MIRPILPRTSGRLTGF